MLDRVVSLNYIMKSRISSHAVVSAVFALSVGLPAQSNRGVAGEWGAVIRWPHVPAHIAQLTDGRMLTLANQGGKVQMITPVGVWTETTDAIMGGKSSVILEMAEAAAGQTALVITGDVKQGAFGQWSGVSYMPTPTFSPADLSAANTLKFRARGEGAAFGVMGFSKAGGQIPAMAPFKVGTDWSEIAIPFSAMRGFDSTGAMMHPLPLPGACRWTAG